MAIFRCKMCGGALEVSGSDGVVICEYCGNKQTIPKYGAEKVASFIEKADSYRNAGEFDKAIEIYEKLLDNNDAEDPELYWNIALCKYGVKYEKDPVSKEYIPTVNRLQYTSILNDENYRKALDLSYSTQKDVYENQAKAIDKIQQEILQISKSEEPYDVFICYKETDDSGRRTHDSLYAYKIYERLIKEGFKVFYARVTLEDKIGKYEPYIFAALHSAKVMIVIGSKKEYFEATWVKNEWSRYLQLLKDKSISRNIVPCYKDMDPYDMPTELAYLQAQDMNKVGFEEDLLRGIKKIIHKNESSSGTNGSSKSSNDAISNYLKRVEIYISDGDWQNADAYCEKALDLDAENGESYKYKLLIEFESKNLEELAENSVYSITNNKNFTKAVLYGCDELKIIEYLEYRSDIWKRAHIENSFIEDDLKKKILKLHYENDEQIKKEIDDLIVETIYQKNYDSYYLDVNAIYNLCLIEDYKDVKEQLNKRYDEIIDFDEEKEHNIKTKISLLSAYGDKYIDKVRELDDKLWKMKKENDERERKEKQKIKFAVAGILLVAVIFSNITKCVKNAELRKRFESVKLVSEYSEDTTIDEMDTVLFGKYPQSDESGNKKDSIEWIVLERDDNKAFLLSKYILDCKCYNDDGEHTNWETCSLRYWLNNEFYGKAFSGSEQSIIQTSNIGSENSVNTTNDKVFCLSRDEIEKYFNLGEGRWHHPDVRLATKGTNYAKVVDNNDNNLLVISSSNWYGGNSYFWYRDSFIGGMLINLVNFEGDIASGYLEMKAIGVRPAMWVKY